MIQNEITLGQGQHLSKFWLQKVQRTEKCTISIPFPTSPLWNSPQAVHVITTAAPSATFERKINKVLNNLTELDLGMMDATALLHAITDSKSGMKDITDITEKLKISVIFCVKPGGAGDASDAGGVGGSGGSGGTDMVAPAMTTSHLAAQKGKVYSSEQEGLFGNKKTMEKKCFDLRNLLTHYHWRLSGRDLSFEEMTAKS